MSSPCNVAALAQAVDQKAADPDRALGLFQDLFAQFPHRPGPLLEMARLARRLGRMEDALANAARYAELCPDDAGLHELAYAAKLAGRHAVAVEAGERLRRRDPARITNLVNLADAYRLSGQTDRARVLSRDALGLDSVHPAAQKLARLLGIRK